jgi:hypothetical protein
MFPVRLLTPVLLPFVLALWFSTPVSAQTARTAMASLTGVVADESGAAVAHVPLTLAGRRAACSAPPCRTRRVAIALPRCRQARTS